MGFPALLAILWPVGPLWLLLVGPWLWPGALRCFQSHFSKSRWICRIEFGPPGVPWGSLWDTLREAHGVSICAQGVGGKHMLTSCWHVVPARVLGGPLGGPWGVLVDTPGVTRGPFAALRGPGWSFGKCTGASGFRRRPVHLSKVYFCGPLGLCRSPLLAPEAVLVSTCRVEIRGFRWITHIVLTYFIWNAACAQMIIFSYMKHVQG